MLQEDIGNKCDINLQDLGIWKSPIDAVGQFFTPWDKKSVSYIFINNSGFVRK